MKKVIILWLLFPFTIVSFGQQSVQQQPDYLKRSKHQKTAAWIFTGAGATVLAVTLLSFGHSAYDDVIGAVVVESVGAVPYLIGGVCIATGAVFFIASSKNKNKTKSTSIVLNMEKAPILKAAMICNQSFPVVGIRIRL